MGMGPTMGLFENMRNPGMGLAGMSGMSGMSGINGMNSMNGVNGMNGMNVMDGMGGMGGIHGMNMGMNMNFNQGQSNAEEWSAGGGHNIWNGQQNNNPNAFANGMGGDFGPHAGYGFNVSQPVNFRQPQYPNGDFHHFGHHNRGNFRGRGRGGRGGFYAHHEGSQHNFPHNYLYNHSQNHNQQPYEQQQAQIQQLQAGLASKTKEDGISPSQETKEAQLNSFHDELAPGGQEETREALGGECHQPDSEQHEKKKLDESKDSEVLEEENDKREGVGTRPDEVEQNGSAQEDVLGQSLQEAPTASAVGDDDDKSSLSKIQAIPVVKEEPTESPSMPPPSAQFNSSPRVFEFTRGSGFRGRGPGRFAARGRPHNHLPQEIHASRSAGESPMVTPVEVKGTGVVGAPTGPKAMRAPAISPTTPRGGRGGGFQIMGRAAMMNQSNGLRDIEDRYLTSSLYPPSDLGWSYADRPLRSMAIRKDQQSHPFTSLCQDKHGSHAPSQASAASEEERNKPHEQRHPRSGGRDQYEEDVPDYSKDQQESRSPTPDRHQQRASRSPHRRDQANYTTDSKPRSSRHMHQHQDRGMDGNLRDKDDDSTTVSPTGHRQSIARMEAVVENGHDEDHTTHMSRRSSSHRGRHPHHRHDAYDDRHGQYSSRSIKHDEQDAERNRDRDLEADSERYRRRKRSRRERDEDDYDTHHGEQDGDVGYMSDSHRHRSRRHKRDHDSRSKREAFSAKDGVTSVADELSPPPLGGSSSSSRHKHKHERERERERQRERERERERYVDEDRNRDRHRHHRRHSERKHERDRDRDHNRERHRNRDMNDNIRPTKPSTSQSQNHSHSEKDIHTLEREARNRERLLKEQQRRENVERKDIHASNSSGATAGGGNNGNGNGIAVRGASASQGGKKNPPAAATAAAAVSGSGGGGGENGLVTSTITTGTSNLTSSSSSRRNKHKYYYEDEVDDRMVEMEKARDSRRGARRKR